jgi:hypothetical protein
MQAGDREEFDSQMQILCESYDKPWKSKLEAYWESMQKMSIVEFARCVEFAISALGPDKFPTTRVMWEILGKFRARAPVRQQQLDPEIDTDPRDHLLYFANRMFLRHVITRGGLGSTGKFAPSHGMTNCVASPELLAGRKVITDLVAWFSEPAREGDLDATPAEFVRQLLAGLDRVLPPTPATRAIWSDRIKDPSQQIPFPAFMGRDIRPLVRSVQP